MISIIRMGSQKKKGSVWDHILARREELQGSLQGKGRLLYLTKRARHEDASLFVHAADPNILGDFISNHLGKIEDLASIHVINMIKPVFFPLPKDTGTMKRFSVTLWVLPKDLATVYETLAKRALPDGFLMTYLAFTFRLAGDCIQFSLLAEKEETLNEYLTEVVNRMPGVQNTTVNLIEETVPLVSYDEWKQYSSKHSIVVSWNEEHMISSLG